MRAWWEFLRPLWLALPLEVRIAIVAFELAWLVQVGILIALIAG